ncbi:MAG TPA: SpoIID/LytB domain-containing protein [Firmicutes bacterium]|nr:SpoIID/LytB domain-containing protein [Bacillota bacterium]
MFIIRWRFCSMRNIIYMLFFIFIVLMFCRATAYSAEPPEMRIGITLSGKALELSFDGGYEIMNLNTGASLQLSPGRYKLVFSQGGIKILDRAGDSCGVFKGPLYLAPISSQPSEESFCIHNAVYGSEYRGALEISASGGEVKAINVLDLESYLRAVVPEEMPSSWGNYGGMEALKSQAVAARSFALYNQGLQRHDGYHLCDAQHCQYYGGKSKETDNTDSAVNQTCGEVLTYNGSVIEPHYCASNGGYTELPQNVWSSALPYYKSVHDPYDDPDNPLGLNNYIAHRYSTWEASIPLKSLGSILAAGGYGNPGDVKRIYVASTYESGRVEELRVEGTHRDVSLRKLDARSALGLRSQLYNVRAESEPRVWIASAVNNIEKKECFPELEGKWVASGYTINKMLTGEEFSVLGDGVKGEVPCLGYIFSGQGWGHAVGLSQNGAYNRSRAGHSYRDILSFYYPGAQITTCY